MSRLSFVPKPGMKSAFLFIRRSHHMKSLLGFVVALAAVAFFGTVVASDLHQGRAKYAKMVLTH